MYFSQFYLYSNFLARLNLTSIYYILLSFYGKLCMSVGIISSGKSESMNRLIKIVLFTICFSIFISGSSYALSLASGQITFDIPEALELRSGELREFNNAFNDIINKKLNVNYKQAQLVLQQNGFNKMTKEGLERYCRVMLSILPPNPQIPFNNNEFAEMVRSFSANEMNEFNKMFMDALVQSDPFTKVHQWLEANSVTLGGKFALKYHYDRFSNTNKNQFVDVSIYLIVTKDFIVKLSCSYRTDEKHIFEPAINQFLSSLRVKAE